MIVVSNTSPLTNLAAIGQFDMLGHLYPGLCIADGVWDELNAGGRCWPGRNEVAAADWIKRCTVQNQPLVNALRRDLDRGESETIALAVEFGADLILLDEKEGRNAAVRFGLRPVGIVGVLLEAKKKGFTEELRPHLDALRKDAGFYLSEPLYRHALVLSGEMNG